MTGLFPLDVQRASENELHFIRRFAAPPALVYQAHLDPQLLMKWMGVGMPMVSCEVDAQVGGKFRYVWRDPDLGEMAMNGTFLVLEEGVRIVHEEVFDEDWTKGPAQVTTQFLPDEAGCCLEMTVRYSSAAALEGVLKTPMTEGMVESYEMLDALLAR